MPVLLLVVLLVAVGSPRSRWAWRVAAGCGLMPNAGGGEPALDALGGKLGTLSAAEGWSPLPGRMLHAAGWPDDAVASAERALTDAPRGLKVAGAAGRATELCGAGAR